MVEFVYGSRSCDSPADDALCAANLATGGWGPAAAPTGGGENAVPVPSSNVFFLNNLLVNPKRRPSSQFFEVYSEPHSETPGPPPHANASAADNLVIAGNVFVNLPSGGVVPSMGLAACDDAGRFPGCNEAAAASNNTFNPPGLAAGVKFSDPKLLTLSPETKAALLAAWKPASVPSHQFPTEPSGRPRWVPPSTAFNATLPAGYAAWSVPRDAAGAVRSAGNNLPGARV